MPSAYYRELATSFPDALVVKFEDLRNEPVEVVRDALQRTFGCDFTPRSTVIPSFHDLHVQSDQFFRYGGWA